MVVLCMNNILVLYEFSINKLPFDVDLYYIIGGGVKKKKS